MKETKTKDSTHSQKDRYKNTEVMVDTIIHDLEALNFNSEEARDAVHTILQQAREEQYQQGFIDGAEATGEQAEEIMAVRVGMAREEERERILEEIDKYAEGVIKAGAEEMSDVYIGKLSAISDIEDII